MRSLEFGFRNRIVKISNLKVSHSAFRNLHSAFKRGPHRRIQGGVVLDQPPDIFRRGPLRRDPLELPASASELRQFQWLTSYFRPCLPMFEFEADLRYR